MAKAKKQSKKKFQSEPKYMSVTEAAHELSMTKTTASRIFDEAAADGVTLLQFDRSRRIDRKAFWVWIKKNKDISVQND